MAVQALIGLGIGLYNVYNSIRKNSQAKKLAAQNKRPVYNPDGTIREVYDMATADLDNTYLQDYATRQNDQNNLSGIDAILKSGGSLDFETARGRYGQQLEQSLVQLANQRDKKMAAYNNAAYNIAASKDASFQYNIDAPYKDNKQLEAQTRAEATQARNEGVNQTISSAAQLITSALKPNSGLGDGNETGGNDPSDSDTAKIGGGTSYYRRPGDMVSNDLPGAISPAGMSVNRNGQLTGYDHFGEAIYA